MKTLLSTFGKNRLTAFGATLVFACSGLLIVMFVLDALGQVVNPYFNIVTYILLPGLLTTGLVLVPIGAWIHRRYEHRIGRLVEPYFSFDFNDPVTRRKGWFFASFTVLLGLMLTGATYRGGRYMESSQFCGEACHTVMEPEYVAYQRSSHARVPCVDCHIGPGLPWLLRQKLSGLRQTWHFVTNTYQRPIPSPVTDLRPAREVCEVCHWPQRFYGDVVKSIYSYDEDETNTINLTRIILRVGNHAAQSSGIHSHIEKQVWYLPKDPQRMEMAWVLERKLDGSSVLWIPEGDPIPSRVGPNTAGARRMDCVDCHNRSAHRFEPFERLVDDALTQGNIPRDLPWIKKMAMEAAPEVEAGFTIEQQLKGIRALRQIPSKYRQQYPNVWAERQKDILLATATLVKLFEGTAFPKMKVYPHMQPDLQTHTGCDRCHGVLVAATGPRKGEFLSNDCLLCHAQPQTLSGPEAETGSLLR